MRFGFAVLLAGSLALPAYAHASLRARPPALADHLDAGVVRVDNLSNGLGVLENLVRPRSSERDYTRRSHRQDYRNPGPSYEYQQENNPRIVRRQQQEYNQSLLAQQQLHNQQVLTNQQTLQAQRQQQAAVRAQQEAYNRALLAQQQAAAAHH